MEGRNFYVFTAPSDSRGRRSCVGTCDVEVVPHTQQAYYQFMSKIVSMWSIEASHGLPAPSVLVPRGSDDDDDEEDDDDRDEDENEDSDDDDEDEGDGYSE